jgi:hypothetical protein
MDWRATKEKSTATSGSRGSSLPVEEVDTERLFMETNDSRGCAQVDPNISEISPVNVKAQLHAKKPDFQIQNLSEGKRSNNVAIVSGPTLPGDLTIPNPEAQINVGPVYSDAQKPKKWKKLARAVGQNPSILHPVVLAKRPREYGEEDMEVDDKKWCGSNLEDSSKILISAVAAGQPRWEP